MTDTAISIIPTIFTGLSTNFASKVKTENTTDERKRYPRKPSHVTDSVYKVLLNRLLKLEAKTAAKINETARITKTLRISTNVPPPDIANVTMNIL
jgi:hypothetical protein